MSGGGIAFADSEQVLFKHRCVLKGTEGDLWVTNLRLLWTRSDNGTCDFQKIWPCVQSVFYSPPARGAMIKLKCLLGNGPSAAGDAQSQEIVLKLTGSSKESCVSEMERMKGIVVAVRKSQTSANNVSSASLDTAAVAAITSNSGVGGASVPQGTVRSTDAGRVDAETASNRARLLAADKQLTKQYKDLVEVNKLVTEAEFWATHEDAVHEFTSQRAAQQSIKQGRSNSLLSDLIKDVRNGKTNIDLTVEKKQNIFLMYPAVKRAFDAEVPLRKTETEFWKAYFQALYYNTEMRRAADATDTDETYAKYVDRSDNSIAQNLLTKRLSGLVDAEFDLTASFGDFHAPEQMDPADRAAGNAGDGDGVDDHESSFKIAQKYNKNSMIVVGGNENFLRGYLGNASVDGTIPTSAARRSQLIGNNSVKINEFSELQHEAPLPYIPIHLHNNQQFGSIQQMETDNSTGSGERISDAFGEKTLSTAESVLNGKKEEEGVGLKREGGKEREKGEESGFGSTLQRVVKRLHDDTLSISDAAAAAAKITNVGVLAEENGAFGKSMGAKRGFQEVSASEDGHGGMLGDKVGSSFGKKPASAPLSSESMETTTTMPSSAFGSSIRGRGVVGKSPIPLKSAEELLICMKDYFPPPARAKAFLVNEMHLRVQSSCRKNGTNSVDSGADLPEEFKQEMLEHFSTVTELLRHFYAILHRRGASAPVPGQNSNPSTQKATAIIDRLTQILSKLEAKKRNLMQLALTTGELAKNPNTQQQHQIDQETAIIKPIIRRTTAEEAHLAEATASPSVTLVNSVVQLIQRAKTTWNVFNRATSLA